ncbi:MAG: cell division protein FtsK [Legionellaceae bacterium]|nr:cell division protein FtsK [Legionellaceae bacterium]HCA89737.1 cell division protein FtsK [Legionellales bacterium]|tara:strand:- start:409 stop:2778 length:2370 start_codon:yes stop_codon:yes gene_type:complete
MAKQDLNFKEKPHSLPPLVIKRLSEGGFILILTAALYLFLSLITYTTKDPGWTHQTHGDWHHIHNGGGQVGAYLADGLYRLFGYVSYLLPISAIYAAWYVLRFVKTHETLPHSILSLKLAGLGLFILSLSALLSLEPGILAIDGSQGAGGALGNIIAKACYFALNLQGASLLLMALLLMSITLITGLSWILAVESLGFYTLFLSKKVYVFSKRLASFIQQKVKAYRQMRQAPPTIHTSPKLKKPLFSLNKKTKDPMISPPNAKVSPTPNVATEPTTNQSTSKTLKPKRTLSHALPPLTLLDKGQPGSAMGGYTHHELETLSREVEQHLIDFGIQADVVAVHPGPVITRFELQLAAGIKVSKLSSLAKDLARSLSVTSVRVVEVIPGKTVVGLELPNQQRDMVRLSDVLSSDVYKQAHSALTIALGVDISGHPMVVDLAKMPHLLVAGTTGSGKSVGINAMILSLLFKSTPDEVRLILVDPKMLELSVYDGIPHLLTPVVTDMKEAASALRWCVAEMERRYRLMASLGVRNLAGYNLKINEAIASDAPLLDPFWKPTDSLSLKAPALTTLPYVVVIIDELADMMMVVGKKVEQLIARIAQKARAAGIHLILATQRPSVDVLTGLIKSNIPTRMSFQVSSKIDSRTILDQQGAEQLLGHGDMLYLAPGTGAPLRVHGAFVDDKEVHRIADDWRARGQPDYIDEITQTLDASEGGMGEDGEDTEDTDVLYDQVVEFVVQTRKASISAVQRRFKIGYNRAARLVEEMERTGIVGPLESGMRDVLVNNTAEEST